MNAEALEQDTFIEMLLAGQEVEQPSHELQRSRTYSVLTLNRGPEALPESLFESGPGGLFREEDSLVIVRYQQLAPLSEAGVQAFVALVAKIESAGKKARVLSLARLTELPQALQASSLQQALLDTGLSRTDEVNADFTRVFTEKALEALRLQLKTEAVAGPARARAQGEEFAGYTGMIEFVGPGLRGMAAFTVGEAELLVLLTRMTGKTLTAVDETAQSVPCELANIVVGMAKTALNELGYGISLSALPVLVEPSFQGFFALSDDSVGVVIPLEFDQGKVLLELRFFLES
jgi:chemotaxis protein CheX